MATFRMMLIGAVEARQSYKRGADASVRMRPALNQVADDIMRVIRIQFESQGRRGGGQWAKLDPGTVAAKKRERKDPRIMIGRGRLMDSLTKRRSRNMDLTVTDSEIRLQSRLPYAERLARGDKKSGIPPRPIVRILPGDRTRWANISRDYILRRMHPR